MARAKRYGSRIGSVPYRSLERFAHAEVVRWIGAAGLEGRRQDRGGPRSRARRRDGELSGFQRPGDLASAENDAGRHCFRADELE